MLSEVTTVAYTTHTRTLASAASFVACQTQSFDSLLEPAHSGSPHSHCRRELLACAALAVAAGLAAAGPAHADDANLSKFEPMDALKVGPGGEEHRHDTRRS